MKSTKKAIHDAHLIYNIDNTNNSHLFSSLSRLISIKNLELMQDRELDVVNWTRIYIRVKILEVKKNFYAKR